ncbi:ATPase [Muricauda oceani]|uniref:ATPase n=1 Tax=Flagellimonas oceani TaxID=2698672 RepID=A0A6G7IZN8_9FLAO|nr:ATPase [Allomuricauda oceani]MBW8244841.1 ATPase [Allomuricauda oceani]QII43849.1 ATPase [Allomuricauda oceani]
MRHPAPHIITEGGSQYRLGTLEGRCIQYDFEKILAYLDVKGRLLFGKKFRIYKEDHEILYKLCNYQVKNWGTCKKLGIDPKKGILLSGPVGCGKTSLMRLIRYITPHFTPYDLIPARNISFAFNHIGYSIIEQYGDHRFYCFDDLGVEPMGRHYGKDCNVMGEILLSRHELYLNHRVKTHATTNLNAQELEERYGNRVRSRMRELFNLIGFDKGSRDKRK